MSAEIAEPARVRWNPDRHHTIIGSKRVTAERAYRFLVDERSLLLVAHRFLLDAPCSPSQRSPTVPRCSIELDAATPPSAVRAAHYRITFPHLDRLKPARLVHGARATEMASVTRFGLVEGVPLDPQRATGAIVLDDPNQQRRRDAMPPVWRGDDEARDADHVPRLRSAAIDELVEPVLRPERGVDPADWSPVDVSEIAERRPVSKPPSHRSPCVAPWPLRQVRRRRDVRLEAIAGSPVRITGEPVAIEEPEPIVCLLY